MDLEDVIDDRCEAWSALADERRVQLFSDYRVAGRPIGTLVPGDLDQILDNLLANALDASPEGGRIRVELTGTDPGWVEVHVVDEGPGMGAEERKRAFDRFWQGPGTQGGNSGLGLAIVRQLVVRNQASVELRPAQPRGLDVVIRMAATLDLGASGTKGGRPSRVGPR